MPNQSKLTAKQCCKHKLRFAVLQASALLCLFNDLLSLTALKQTMSATLDILHRLSIISFYFSHNFNVLSGCDIHLNTALHMRIMGLDFLCSNEAVSKNKA